MTDACQPRCRREGLAIYPVMYTAIGNDVAMKFQPLPRPFGQGVTDKVLRDNFYALRGLDPGYVYVLYPNYRWAGYLVDCAGYLRYYPDLDVEDMPDEIPNESDVEKCATQSGKTHTGIEALCIEQPDTIKGTVYIAFSRVKWGLKARTTHAAFPEQRMQPIERLDGSPFNNAEVISDKNLKNLVVDFNPGQRPYMNWTLPTDQWVKDRSARAASLPKAMLAMSGALKVPGLIMALHDPMGLAIRLNAARNRLSGLAASVSGLGDKLRARKRVVAEIIEGIRLSAIANPGPLWDRNYGPERYIKHIKQSDWKDALTEQEALKSYRGRIKVCSQDYVLWKESPAWKIVQARDFDEKDDSSVKRHELLMAKSVVGSGQTSYEREGVWKAVLALPGDSHDNWLMRSFTAMHKEFLEYVSADHKEDKVYDIEKNAAAYIKGITEKNIKSLAKFHAELHTNRTATEATAVLIDSITGLLMRLHEENPSKFNKLIRTIASVLITRADVVPQPVVVRGTASKVAEFINRVANFREGLNGDAPVERKPVAGKPGARKGNFGPKAWELAEAAGEEIVFKAPGTSEEVKTTVAWVLRKLRSGANLDEASLKAIGLRNVDLTVPSVKENPFLENHLTRLSAKADLMLGVGSTLYQVYSFSVALKTFNKVDTKEKIDGGIGMVTAVLSASSGLMEIRGAIAVLSANNFGASRSLLVAGKLSLASGIIEGIYLIAKGFHKGVTTNDIDSAFWTMGTGVFVFMGGVAGYGASAAGAAVVAGDEVATVALMGVEGGPLVWTLLAVGLLAAGLYCGWQAWATDDNNLLPVEYWLDNGVFGKREYSDGDKAAENPFAAAGKAEPFANLDLEIQGLHRVIFVAQVRLNTNRDRHGFSVLCSYAVAIPRYDVGTRLEVRFVGVRSGKRFDAGFILCENGAQNPTEAKIDPRLTGMRSGPEAKVDRKSGTLNLEGYFSTMQEPTIVNKAFDSFGWQKDTNLYADHFEIHVKYWPDKENLVDVISEKSVSA